jgi:hypothetical protein
VPGDPYLNIHRQVKFRNEKYMSLVERKLVGLPDDAIERMGDFYFPINVHQFEDLVGKVLTQFEAINLPEKVEQANKDIVKQLLWRWFDNVQENSITSWKAIVGPIDIKEREKELGWIREGKSGLSEEPAVRSVK